MDMRSIFRHIIKVFCGILLVAGCAKISSPSGGPKDVDPPVVIKSVPENGTKNFKGKRIVISFNEYIVLDKINEKFMVSPPLGRRPQITIKGKNIIIQYTEELRDSTTYTFYFQDAVRDLNEGNAISNYQFVFSTGPVIDSLSVTGNVYKASDLNPPEATLISLYIEKEDSAFMKNLPSYISISDKNGYFRIDNVSAREYRIYALKDVDNSKNFNLADEEIAFLDSMVVVTPEKNWLPLPVDTLRPKLKNPKAADTIVLQGDYKLYLFQHQKKLHYLTSSSRGMAYRLNYTLSLPPDTSGFGFSIPGADSGSYYMEMNKTGDSIQVWLTDSSLYSRQIINSVINYPFTDSSGITALKEDTIMMRFMTPRATRGKTKPAPFRFTSNISSGTLKPGRHIILNSQTPFREPDTSKIRLLQAEGTNMIRLPFNLKKDSTNSCRLTLTAKLAMNKNYIFIADSASLGNIYGEQSDSTATRFTVKSEESYGKLVLNVMNYEGNRIIQLLTEAEKMLSEVFMEKDGKIEFPLLERGAYRVRVIYDLNNDGKWTTGDFYTKRQPEPVSYLPVDVDIKENWVREYDWDISEKNSKKLKIKPTQSRGRM
ncbi:MAG TPA: hypothetical protein DDW27_03245 [Bacteroidales bacterium]|nr:hypothetical protein [Bacteroidales bacterium]